MVDEKKVKDVTNVLRQINQAWLTGRFDELESHVHPDFVLVHPGFAERNAGCDDFIEGHREFHNSATVHEFQESEHQVDVVGNTAVATFRFEMVYQRLGERYRSTGRDLWVLHLQGDEWLAVWRTILDVEAK